MKIFVFVWLGQGLANSITKKKSKLQLNQAEHQLQLRRIYELMSCWFLLFLGLNWTYLVCAHRAVNIFNFNRYQVKWTLWCVSDLLTKSCIGWVGLWKFYDFTDPFILNMKSILWAINLTYSPTHKIQWDLHILLYHFIWENKYSMW